MKAFFHTLAVFGLSLVLINGAREFSVYLHGDPSLGSVVYEEVLDNPAFSTEQIMAMLEDSRIQEEIHQHVLQKGGEVNIFLYERKDEDAGEGSGELGITVLDPMVSFDSSVQTVGHLDILPPHFVQVSTDYPVEWKDVEPLLPGDYIINRDRDWRVTCTEFLGRNDEGDIEGIVYLNFYGPLDGQFPSQQIIVNNPYGPPEEMREFNSCGFR